MYVWVCKCLEQLLAYSKCLINIICSYLCQYDYGNRPGRGILCNDREKCLLWIKLRFPNTGLWNSLQRTSLGHLSETESRVLLLDLLTLSLGGGAQECIFLQHFYNIDDDNGQPGLGPTAQENPAVSWASGGVGSPGIPKWGGVSPSLRAFFSSVFWALLQKNSQ